VVSVKPLARDECATPVPTWLGAVVLAGGEGVRLRPLARHVSGDERSKQYVALLGVRTLVEQTLDRVARLGSPERTVIVETRPFARYHPADTQSGRAPHVLAQPERRRTAAGILYPTHWIAARIPTRWW
jgi:mannose-1-phosphate guanylyltransferase